MKNIRFLFSVTLLITLSLSALGQNDFVISNKDVTAWAPLDEGMANCYSRITNTSATDSVFIWEYLDKTQPTGWTLGFCAENNCYSIPSKISDTFHVKVSGGFLDFDCTHSFGSSPNYTKGTGTGRFLIYRSGMRSLADTILFRGIAAGTGISKDLRSQDIHINPNPVKQSLTLDIPNEFSCSFVILNFTGEEIMRLKSSEGNTIDMSSLPNGIYFLRVENGKEVYNKKFILSH
jgi:hypothetical protein